MDLTFTHAALKKVHADGYKYWNKGTVPLYGQDKNPTPGFWLIADHGIYIMHNGKTDDDKPRVLAYALECDPETLDFETWWENKLATWGGDDGVELLNYAVINQVIQIPGAALKVKISETELEYFTELPSLTS